MEPLTIDELRALPVMTTLMTAARALGIKRTLAYELARAGAFPCPVIRTGRRYQVPTTGLLAVLDFEIPPPDITRGRRAEDL
jgi:hypothetical protein